MPQVYILQYTSDLKNFKWTKLHLSIQKPMAFQCQAFLGSSKTLVCFGGRLWKIYKNLLFWLIGLTEIKNEDTTSVKRSKMNEVLCIKPFETDVFQVNLTGEDRAISDASVLITPNEEIFVIGGYGSTMIKKQRKDNNVLDLLFKVTFNPEMSEGIIESKIFGVGFASGFCFLPIKNTMFITCGTVSR